MSSYGQIPVQDDDDHNDDHNDDQIELTERNDRPDDDDDDAEANAEAGGIPDEEDHFDDEHGEVRIPMEVQEKRQLQNALNRWEDPWIISVTVTLVLLIPALVFLVVFSFRLTGRLWSGLVFSIHILIALVLAKCCIPKEEEEEEEEPTSGPSLSVWFRVFAFIAILLDLVLLALVYPWVIHLLVKFLWTDADGTIIVEWSGYVRQLTVIQILGWVIVALRCLVGGTAFFIQATKLYDPHRFANWRPTFWLPTTLTMTSSSPTSTSTPTPLQVLVRTRLCFRRITTWMIYAALLLNAACLLSGLSHFGPWPMPSQANADCDPLDPNECALPFPSFHHMVPDVTTETGWRVHLKGSVLPPLRGGLEIHPGFFNELDGFSTMAPILFYMDGLKEAQEQQQDNSYELQGPEQIQHSITLNSITLLLDVASQQLVYHSAEIDYLDEQRPMVMIFPSQPLKHNTHYAVAVLNAADAGGHRLPPTMGLEKLFHQTNSPQRTRFHERVIPALEAAASWFSFQKDPKALQLLFDFHTISESSQLGMIRGVRDATMNHLGAKSAVTVTGAAAAAAHSHWQADANAGKDDVWDWRQHARAIDVQDWDCDGKGDDEGGGMIARTIHAEIDVPWFLTKFGAGGRGAILDRKAVESGTPVTLGQAKFIVQVPCSVRNAALGQSGGKPLRSIMEYGHGLFGNREEVKDYILSRMANENGYILTAMDWRGMSMYDLPIVIKTLIGTPRLFQAVRDNLIQGYANKLAMQHFSQHGMLEMEWLKFDNTNLPTYGSKPPSNVFYGISQGGILGAGYTALSGPTGLIDRGVLGVPGTPFALVLTRSLDFVGYDALLLMNFYTNRHVRIFLSLVQMAWDSVEASGLLAKPVTEPYPRLLLQAGLGDSIVPTNAAEALARALGAKTLPNNPRHIFGIDVSQAADETQDGPDVTLTELLYEKEFNSLPLDDVPAKHNSVHFCVRTDEALIIQIAEFVNAGRVIDPCEHDQCRRISSSC